MYLKLTGAILILTGCGGYGIALAVSHRREAAALHQLIRVVDRMSCELACRLTALPELCRFGAEQCGGPLQTFFLKLAKNMDGQVSPDVGMCVLAALKETVALPSYTSAQLRSLGQTLGRFDIQGQLTSLERCRQSCQEQLEVLEHQQTQRMRSYQTLGFCAGAALAILLF